MRATAVFSRDTRGKSRDGEKKWSGCERDGTGTGNSVIFRSRPQFPDPFRRWFLFPPSTIPSESSCSRPDCFPSHCSPPSRLFPVHRLRSCSHPIPTFAHNFFHPAYHYYHIGAVISLPFTTGFLDSSCKYGHVYATLLFSTFSSRYSFFNFFFFPLAKKRMFPP